MYTNECGCAKPTVQSSVRGCFDNAVENGTFAKICAPMVRYSQLPFRLLTRKYGCDIAFSPMIVASSFGVSDKARLAEFSTCPGDHPLVVQFGATNTDDLVSAAGHVVQLADGIDINCGCPQRWAIKEGLGCALLDKPELVREMVMRLKNAYPIGQLDHDLTISVKIRIFKNERKTIDLVEKLARSGIDFITIHGRTVSERGNDLPHWDIVSAVNENALKPHSIPLVINGGIQSLEQATETAKLTGASGVMAAENLLRNPALFASEKYERTPPCCFEDFIALSKPVEHIDSTFGKGHNLKFDIFRKHLCEMMSGLGIGRRSQKIKEFNRLRYAEGSINWVRHNITEATNLDILKSDDNDDYCDTLENN